MMINKPAHASRRLAPALWMALLIVIAALIAACAPAQPAATDEPLIEAVEGAHPVVTLSTPVVRQTPPPGGVTGVSTQVALGSPLPVVSPSIPAAGSTPIPTASPGSTRTPIPTARLPQSTLATPTPSATSAGQPGATPSRTPTVTTTIAATATPTATSTPTPTPTVIASACHAATQRPLGSTNWSIDHVCLYDLGNNQWQVFGDLTNNTGSDQMAMYIDVSFFDASGSEVATDYIPIDVQVLPTGRSTPFWDQFYTTTAPSQYGLNVTSNVADVVPRTDLVVSDIQLKTINGVVVVSGQITVPGSPITDYAEVVIAFYDRSGAVVAYGYARVFQSEFDAAQTAKFEGTVEGQMAQNDHSGTPFVLGY